MKLSLDPAVTAPRRITQESLVMASWYDAHPAVRRLWALKDSQTLHVIVTLEPTVDNGESYPVWFANNVVWAREIRSSTGSFVTLELVDEPLGDESEIEIDGEGEIIIAMCWRDPALLWSALL